MKVQQKASPEFLQCHEVPAKTEACGAARASGALGLSDTNSVRACVCACGGWWWIRGDGGLQICLARTVVPEEKVVEGGGGGAEKQ